MGVPFESGAYGEYSAYILAMSATNEQEHSRLVRHLRRAITQELTPRQRETLVLYYSAGLSMTDIARHQGVTVSTVSRSLERSRKRLERCLRYGGRELLRESVEGK